MRKFLSLFITIAMLMSLVPTFAFATDVETVAPVVIDFTKATLPDGQTKVDGASSLITSPEFSCVVDECSAYGDAQRTHYKTAEGMKLLTVGVSHGSWNSLPWDNANGNAKKAKWTIEMDLPTAGWYEIDFIIGKWASAADFYIYADGQYAGVLNCYDAEMTDTFHNGTDTLENAVYLTPDENGKIKMMFALKAQYTSSPGRMLLNKMTLTYIGENDPYILENTIPETIPYNGNAEFTVCAKNSDGTVFANNGLNADKTARAEVVTVSVKDGNTVSVTKTSEENGVYSYRIDALGIGKSTLLITSDAGGKIQTKEVPVTVANPTVAEAIELEFTKTTMNEPYKIAPPGWTLTDKANFTIAWDETTTYNGARFNDSSIFDGGKILWLGTRAYSNLTWIKAKSNVQANETDAMFTVETTVYVPGWYNFGIYGAAISSGSEYYVYVNDKYAGLYSFWKEGEAGFVSGGEKKLNSIYITPDANNKVRISLCVAETHYSTAYAAPYKMWLTPVAGNNVTFKKFVHNIPGTLEQGESADVELYAEMSDGTYRHINGYAHDATVDSTNSISLTAKSGDSVGFESTYNALLGDGKYTGKLTASKAGNTTFTAKVMIDGKEYTDDITIIVPENKPGEEVAEKVSIYITGTEGGSVSADKVAVNEVTTANTGEAITAEAEASEGYKFAYWKDSAGNVVSEASEYTFKAFTNTSIIAVFDNVSGDAKKYGVEFFDGNRDFLGFVEVAKGDLFSSVKAPAANLTGYEFKGWSIAENAIINGILRAVALYEEEGKPVTGITFNNGTVENTKYDEPVSNTVEGAKTWYRDEKLVGYGASYTYYVWGDTDITSSTEDVEKKLPIAVLDKNGDSYMLEYDNAGYTIVDAGILFGDDTHNTVNACYYKAKVKNIKAHGQFTAKKSSNTKYPQTKVRGYVMFLDGDDIRVIYAD